MYRIIIMRYYLVSKRTCFPAACQLKSFSVFSTFLTLDPLCFSDADDDVTVGKFYATYLIQEYFRRFKARQKAQDQAEVPENNTMALQVGRRHRSSGVSLPRDLGCDNTRCVMCQHALCDNTRDVTTSVMFLFFPPTSRSFANKGVNVAFVSRRVFGHYTALDHSCAVRYLVSWEKTTMSCS